MTKGWEMVWLGVCGNCRIVPFSSHLIMHTVVGRRQSFFLFFFFFECMLLVENSSCFCLTIWFAHLVRNSAPCVNTHVCVLH